MNATISSREARLSTVLTTIHANPGRWTAGRLHDLRKTAGRGPSQRGTARRDLAELHRRGLLRRYGPRDGRYYLPATGVGAVR
ncbi:hypothetical protein [Streptomyces europaeiscabiei]|uniref:hypothetical protein n=1 Tax=Streptomyces europaeiscabiei TaxID=146819 RepID=UPI0029A40DF9|nr:hypothetical protein [Streptomyces europaeiscabiei]MDX3835655.1 hypothetical protein [Streptomyces europaeiscabiei]